MAVDGAMTSYHSSVNGPGNTALRFGAIEIDPTALPVLVRELQLAGPAA